MGELDGSSHRDILESWLQKESGKKDYSEELAPYLTERWKS